MKIYFLVLTLIIILSGCVTMEEEKEIDLESLEVATFAGGCFWCMEAAFEASDGVAEVISGYTGGEKEDPSYEEVSSGATGHYEAIQVYYDPSKITYEDLLAMFWRNIDPTDSGGQFVDRGSQYKTAIFYHNETQKELAEKSKENLEKSGKFDKPVVTEILPFSVFYKAEDYHQNYFNLHGNAPYCTFIVQPKLEKFKKIFKDKLKKNK